MPFEIFTAHHNVTLSQVASLSRMNLRSPYTDAILADSDVPSIGIGIVVDNARGPKARPRLRLSRNSNGAFECDRIYGEYREGVIYGCFCSLGAHP